MTALRARPSAALPRARLAARQIACVGTPVRGGYPPLVPRLTLVVEPDKDEAACAEILIDALVNGTTRRFILDTGAPTSQVSHDDVTTDLNVVGSYLTSGLFGGQALDLVLLPELEIGDLRFQDLAVRRSRQRGFAGDNLLGLDVLGRHACRINIEERWLELGPTGCFPTTGRFERGDRGHCIVRVTGQGFNGRACIDTGAGITLVDTEFFAAHQALFTFRGLSTGSDTNGTQAEVPTYVMWSVTIGSVDFAPSVVAVVDLSKTADGLEMVLGYPTLRQAEWTLDLPKCGIAITPRSMAL
jgi:predicted aspartyl protease